MVPFGLVPAKIGHNAMSKLLFQTASGRTLATLAIDGNGMATGHIDETGLAAIVVVVADDGQELLRGTVGTVDTVPVPDVVLNSISFLAGFNLVAYVAAGNNGHVAIKIDAPPQADEPCIVAR